MHATFLLLAAWVGWQGWLVDRASGLGWSLTLFAGLFGSTVLHELGHCAAAARYGISTHSIVLLPIGGVAQLARIPREPERELVITLAGPAVNFALVALLWPLTGFDWHWWGAPLPSSIAELGHSLIIVNLVMGLFNFLPIFPMDGGRILRALLSLKLPYLSATRLAAHSGKVLACIAMVLCLWHVHTVGVLPVFLFAFVFVGGDMEYRGLKRQERLAGIDVAAVTRSHGLRLPPRATITEALDLLSAHRPQDILVADYDRPVGVLPLENLRRAAERGLHTDAVAMHMVQPIMIFQADWPLSLVEEALRRSPQRLFPVLRHGQFIGAVDARTVLDSVDWIRLIRRVQGDEIPQHPAGSRHGLET